MIDKILGAIHVAESQPEGLKRMAQLVTGISKISDQEVGQLLTEAASMSTASDLSPIPDQDGNWKTRLDLLIPVVQALLVREVKLAKEARKNSLGGEPETHGKSETATAWSEGLHQAVDTLYFATPPDSELRCHLLQWLALGCQDKRLKHWVLSLIHI